MASAEQTAITKGAALSLEGRVDVFPDQPLTEFGGPETTTCAARFKTGGPDLMAVVFTGNHLTRMEMANAMRTIDHPCILRLHDSGLLDWPARNGRYYAAIYDRPLAPRYRTSIDSTYPTMSEDSINRLFVTPMIGALAEFQRTGIVHGGIRPTNLFWRDGNTTPPQLGECLALPAGFGQPVLFETIERGMCPPIGRGPGCHTDDCYAFGVTLALLIVGHNPLQGLDDKAILQAKMERGTFNALIGSQRLAPSQIELLRGLLTDDGRQRWTAAELEQWQGGRRQTPKSTDAGRRANRHITVGGKEYWQLRPLAAALAENVPEAAKLIESAAIGKWLSRSFGDEDCADAVDAAVSESKEKSSTHPEDQLVTRVCIALDPTAPIRYRGVAVMPMAIAGALAEALIMGTSTQLLGEILANQFLSFWADRQKESKTDLVPFLQQMERARSALEKTTFGNGVERAAYELNPYLPCLSPLIRTHFVTSPRKILPALEAMANTAGRPPEPMDRHLAAFLVVRDKRSELLFAAMSPSEPQVRRGLAMLTLFGEMQYHFGPDNSSGLANWLMPFVEPNIQRFLSKPFQEKVRRQAKEAVTAGNLMQLLRIVDDPQRIEHDRQEFFMARDMYQKIQAEIADIEGQLNHRAVLAKTAGLPIAATIGSALAILFIVLTVAQAMLRSLG